MSRACDAIAAACFLYEAELKRQRPIHSSSNIHILPVVAAELSGGTSASKEKEIKEQGISFVYMRSMCDSNHTCSHMLAFSLVVTES